MVWYGFVMGTSGGRKADTAAERAVKVAIRHWARAAKVDLKAMSARGKELRAHGLRLNPAIVQAAVDFGYGGETGGMLSPIPASSRTPASDSVAVSPVAMLDRRVALRLRDRKPVRYAEGARWVYQNICNPLVEPEDSPDMGTWGLLCLARSDPALFTEFYRTILATVRSSKVSADDDGVGLAEAELSVEFDRLIAAEAPVEARPVRSPVRPDAPAEMKVSKPLRFGQASREHGSLTGDVGAEWAAVSHERKETSDVAGVMHT